MIFGDPTDFAIEAYHEPYDQRSGGCGRFCLHVQGKVLGDIRDNHCSLFNVTDRLRELSECIEDLWDELFAGLSDQEIFRLIDNEIYIGEPSSVPDMVENMWRFDFLTNSAEMFNGCKTFIIRRPEGRVCIVYRLRDDTWGCGSCSTESFLAVVRQYVPWFDEQVRTMAPPFFPINPFDLNEKVPEGWPDK